MFDLGIHTHYDDSTSIKNPMIIGMQAEINVGAFEGIIWNRLGNTRNGDITMLDDYRYELYDRSRTALTGVVGDGAGMGWADNSDTTDLPMTAAAVGILTVGDVLEIEDEQVVVSSVDRSANTINVFSRGYGSSAAASHSDTTAFTIIGKAINDTDLKNVESFAEQTGKYTNYIQTVSETIDMTFTDEIQARKMFKTRPQLVLEALDRVAQRLSKTVVLGRQQAGTKSLPSSTAGILHQLSNGGGVRSPLRYNASGVTDPESVVKNMLISAWNNGGNPTHIYLSPTNKRYFDTLMEQHVRMNRNDARVVGTENSTGYMYQGKLLPFVEDESYPTDRVSLVTENLITRGWKQGDVLRGPVKEPQASSRELRYSIQGSMFINVKGVGNAHVDGYNVAFA